MERAWIEDGIVDLIVSCTSIGLHECVYIIGERVKIHALCPVKTSMLVLDSWVSTTEDGVVTKECVPQDLYLRL